MQDFCRYVLGIIVTDIKDIWSTCWIMYRHYNITSISLHCIKVHHKDISDCIHNTLCWVMLLWLKMSTLQYTLIIPEQCLFAHFISSIVQFLHHNSCNIIVQYCTTYFLNSRWWCWWHEKFIGVGVGKSYMLITSPSYV